MTKFFTMEFDDSGGYDCMTAAYKIKCGKQLIASVDCADYGQENCSPLPFCVHAKAHEMSQLIVTAVNEYLKGSIVVKGEKE